MKAAAPLSPLQKAYLKLEEMQARLEALEKGRREPIAIVGVACRFPGGVQSPRDYWDLLEQGRDAVTEVPPDRWAIDAYYDPDPQMPGKMYTRWGGFLADVDQFDAAFFGISPREAASMDPQQRLLLEVSWEALENAGIAPDELAGSRTGVFVGIGFNDYARLLAAQDVREVSAYSGSGIQLCFAAGRVSYTLGLRGPSIALDTACSSSLVALHQACQSLRAGDSDMGLVGGVNLLLAPEGNIFLSKAGALSPTGRCRTFDASADGMVRGDGCGVIVLKRLSDAVAAGDDVLAVIRGSAVNHDGRSSGLTVPSGPAQEAVMRQALKNADVEPQAVDYVEAHGTGTPLGDPIELQSTTAVYGRRPAGRPLVIASVKTNFGHLEAASGIASVVKVALMLRKATIPRHLHFRAWNPHVEMNGVEVQVPRATRAWPGDSTSRRVAAVSSFGLSGTNAHVVLEQAPDAPQVARQEPADPLELLAISAKKPAALQTLVRQYIEVLGSSEESLTLNEVCRSAAVGRSHHDYRLSIAAGSNAEVSALLSAHLAGRSSPAVVSGRRPLDRAPQVAFVFSGQGAQWAGMGAGLFEREAVFREAVEECGALIQAETGRTLMDDLRAVGSASRLGETEVAQPALFAIQVGLAALWRSWGIEPDAVVGHSLGEVAAAHVSGALDRVTAVRLVCRRGALMQRATGEGRMAAVGLSPEEGLARIRELEDRLSVAAVNAPRSIVLSGDGDALDQVLRRLRDENIFCRMLPVKYAFHSPQTASLGAELAQALNGLAPRANAVPLVSSVTGALVEGRALDGNYWARNVTDTVRFATAIETLVASGHRLFLEIAPDRVLASPVLQTLEARSAPGTVLPSLRRGVHERSTLLTSLATLYAQGCSVAWRQVYSQSGPRVALPTYPWQHQRFWIEGGPLGQPVVRAERSVAASDAESVDDWLYELQWSARPAESIEDAAPGVWLILSDKRGVGSSLSARLERAGHACLVIRREDIPRPARPKEVSGGAFRAVVERALDQTKPFRGVVHLWSLDATAPEHASVSSLMEDQHLGARSAVELIQALSGVPRAGNPSLWLVTRGVQRVGSRQGRLAVSQSPLWAIGRTCAAEHPDLWGGLADLDPDATSDDAASHLLEAIHATDHEDQVAYSGGERYVARLARLGPEDCAATLEVRPESAYLVTGGLDGVGLEVARWLTRKGARHLVLVGRTKIPGRATWSAAGHSDGVCRRIAAIEDLEKTGAHVEYPSIDVTDEAQVAALADSIRRSGRPLAGIVHAASVWRDADGRGLVGPLSSTTPESFDVVLPPKLVGSWLLQQLCDRAALDFIVFFSSGAALVGSAGQGNYAAANAFMDSLAHDLAERVGVRALSINWGPISDIGFGGTPEGRAVFDLWRRRGIMAVTPAQLIEALELLISRGGAQAGVMKTDWDALRTAYAEMLEAPWASRLVTSSGARPRVDLTKVLQETRPADRHDVLATQIQGQVVAVMGFGPAETPEFDQGLFDLGMDSLLALDLKNRLQTGLRREVPVAALFEHPTIASLADYLLAEILHLPTAEEQVEDRRAPKDVVASIADMSEAEVERLLAARITEGTA